MAFGCSFNESPCNKVTIAGLLGSLLNLANALKNANPSTIGSTARNSGFLYAASEITITAFIIELIGVGWSTGVIQAILAAGLTLFALWRIIHCVQQGY
jgi:hypothetical protein